MLQIDGRDMKAAEQGMTDRNRFLANRALKAGQIPNSKSKFDSTISLKPDIYKSAYG